MSMCPVCNNPIDSQAPVCPHCGFKLLGSTQRFEPVSFGDDALPVAAAPQAAAALHVVRGPQTPPSPWPEHRCGRAVPHG